MSSLGLLVAVLCEAVDASFLSAEWHAKAQGTNGMVNLTDVYGLVPDFDDIMPMWELRPENERDTIVNALMDVIRNHGLAQHVAVAVAHTHFEIPQNTVLVENLLIDEQKSIMAPVLIDNVSSRTVPYSFALNAGVWKPYQYVINSSTTEYGLKRVLGNSCFLEEYALKAQSLKAEDVIGFHILHWDHIRGTYGTLEKSFSSNSSLVMYPNEDGKFPEGFSGPRRVYWRFGSSSAPDVLGNDSRPVSSIMDASGWCHSHCDCHGCHMTAVV